MSTIREQIRTTFMGLAGLLSKMNTLQGKDTTISMTTMDGKLGDIEEVLDYIEEGGMPSIESIAKQGTNPLATNTAILEETINNGSLLDQSIAAQLYAIIGEGENESTSEN